MQRKGSGWSSKKRYAIVVREAGLDSSIRLWRLHTENSEIAAFCDINQGRMNYASNVLVNERC